MVENPELANLPKDLKLWNVRIEASKKRQKEDKEKGEGWLERTNKYVKYYQDIFYTDPQNKERISVSLVFSAIRTSIASLFLRNPEMIVRPKKPDQWLNAKLFQSVLNHELKYTVDFQKEDKRVLLDNTIRGYGVFKFGFDDKKEEIWGERFNPVDFFPPADANTIDIDKLPYIMFRFIKPLEEVQANDKFINTKDLEPTDVASIAKDIAGYEDLDDSKRVVYYEIFYYKDGEIWTQVIAEGYEKYLKKPVKYDVGHEGYPADIMVFNETPDKFYGTSDVEHMERQVREKNLLRSRFAQHWKATNKRYAYNKDKMDADEIVKWEGNDDSSAIGVNGPPRDSVLPLEHNPIATDWFMYDRYLDKDIRESIGLDVFSFGGSSSGDTTATEVAAVESGTRNRNSERKWILEQHVLRIVRKYAQIIKKNYKSKRYVNMLGDEGSELGFVEYTKKDLDAEFDFDIRVGSTLPVDTAILRRQWIQLLPVLAPFLQGDPKTGQGGNPQAMQALMREILDTFDVKNPVILEAFGAPSKQSMQAQQPQATTIGALRQNIQAQRAQDVTGAGVGQ